ncbi:FAD-dependent thymidylate synthase, partial [Thermus scotoductus]
AKSARGQVGSAVLKVEFYVPQAWRKQARRNKQGSEGELSDEEATLLRKGVEREAYQAYQTLLEKGIAREMARMVLPLNRYTEFYWKQDLHNLFHSLGMRLEPHDQWEIRQYAKGSAEIVKAHVPLAWHDFEENT